MRIAVLPINAAPGANEALGRQIAVFLSELMRSGIEEGEIAAVNYMGRVEENGVIKHFQASPSEGFNDLQILNQMFGEGGLDGVVDGLLEPLENGSTRLTLRWFTSAKEEPDDQEAVEWAEGGMLQALHPLMLKWMTKAGGTPRPGLDTPVDLFKTSSDSVFLNYMVAYDAVQYIERAEGMVVESFSPEQAFAAALNAIKEQPGWENVFFCLMELARLCVRFRLGTPDMIGSALQKCVELQPDNDVVLFHVGSFLVDVGDPNSGAEMLEKASRNQPEQPGIWVRLGHAQLAMGMPVNAERSLKKALELNSDEEASVAARDLLTQVLMGTGRAHEVPALWKELVDAEPENPAAVARYAQALMTADRQNDAVAVLEKGLELDENLPIKRVLAPILRDSGDHDRAMDFYEDCLDEDPTDIQTLLEYAQTLQEAGREFEAVRPLQEVLQANPDPNTRAQTQAWLIELEQPKRVQAVQSASEKAEAGDFEGAMRELKPVRNWLADYWKVWALLASIHNRLGEHRPAEEAATKLLEMFPACEPGYGELANALTGQGRHEEAYQLMKVALNNIPNSLGIALNFGLCAKRAGHAEEGLEMAKRIREALGPDTEFEPILAEIER